MPSADSVIDWNPINAGSAGSAFAAVLAGFVFLGVVYLLTDNKAAKQGHTLILFWPRLSAWPRAAIWPW